MIETDVKQLVYSSDLFYVATAFLSRLIVALLFKRLSSSNIQIKLSLATAGACVLLGVASILAVGVQSSDFFSTANISDPNSQVQSFRGAGALERVLQADKISVLVLAMDCHGDNEHVSRPMHRCVSDIPRPRLADADV